MLKSRLPAYAELHALTSFSFLRGASHPQELMMQARQLGYQALAVTDECSLAGVVRAHTAAGEGNTKLVIGSEISLSDGPRIVLLATDRDAYGELSALITRGRRRGRKGEYELRRADLESGVPGCLALLVPGRTRRLPAASQSAEDKRFKDEQMPRPARQFHTEDFTSLLSRARWLKELFPTGAWIAVELFLEAGDGAYLQMLRRLAKDSGLSLVAAGDVHMHCRGRRILQDALTAVRLGTTIEAAGLGLYSNGERHLRSRQALARIYPPELLAETLEIADRCRFSLDELRYEYPEELVPRGQTPASWLRTLTEAGMRRRWPGGIPGKVRGLIEHELALIAELDYEAYFLTVYDIVEFARSQGILCQGRGSAANSAVCYALGITEVDPARMEMLFERFISKERNEPPDIDVDFEHERREEVIQYVYNKYGRDRAALAATVITYRPKSAVRDMGKALGMSLEQVDRLAKNIYWWDGKELREERLREVGFEPDNPTIMRLLALVTELMGFPRHLSQHVGGFVIARDSLERLVPVENAAMPERTVIQWDKDDLEALGLLKVDCLCLGMLSAIHRAFDLIADYSGRRLSLASVPAEDPATYAMIQKADTVGVFQIESRAQMAMLPRLCPSCYYDLVIEVAIIRPGPIQGEMVHPYLRRRNGLEPVTYPSRAIRGVLERTLGVPLFQEQVIKLAMVAAGFSPGEADRLRRSMASWKRNGGLQHFEQRLIDGMRERGYTEKFARQIYQQILGFGEYGFPESHSASFALLAYVSAWLKCHEPAAFTCALLNSQPMGFYAPAQLVQDARRHGVEVRPVDVCTSDWDCTLESADKALPPALRLGLRMLKGFAQTSAARLAAARAEREFTGVQDLAQRAALRRRDLEILAAAGALSSLVSNRYQARWQVLGVEEKWGQAGYLPKVKGRADPGFFHSGEATPMLRPPTEAEDIVADYASLGLSLRRHPLAVLRPQLEQRHFLTAQDVAGLNHGSPVRTAGLVITRQRPGTATGVVFVTLEDETGHINLIVWSSLVDAQRRELLASRLLGVNGEVQRDGEVIHVIAKRLEDHSPLLGVLAIGSRDFH